MRAPIRLCPAHELWIDDATHRVKTSQTHSALVPLFERYLRVARLDGEITVYLGARRIARLGAHDVHDPLTAFEARAFADRGAPLPALPPELAHAPLPLSPRTDLHTHFAGALPGETLVSLAAAHGMRLSADWLERVGVFVDGEVAVSELGERARRSIATALDMPVDAQSFFLEMERRYELRRPFTKSSLLFVPQLHAIAAHLAESGVSYAELSLSESLEPAILSALHAHLDDVERQHGVRLRFLVAFRRADDAEWDLDILERYRDCLASRAVVGIDIMGHEACATSRVAPVLAAAGALARQRPGLVVRVHAGENPAYPQNVREALHLLRPFPDVEVRIGHGLYGLDDALLAEMARARDRVIVEINLTSNLALNNIQDAPQVPLQRLLDAGVSVVLGTDGAGLYQTHARDEVRAALACGVAPRALARIADIERALLERKAEGEERLPALSAFVLPPSRAPVHFTEAVRTRIAVARADAERALTARCDAIGARVERARPALGGRPALWIAGAWKHAILEWNAEQRARAETMLDALMRELAERQAVVITGGTHHGVEGLAHTAAVAHGVPVIGAIPDDVPPEDLDARVTRFWRCAPSMWGKAEPLVTLLRDVDGLGVFFGGGLVVADEQQAAANLGVRHVVVRGLPGFASAASRVSAKTAFVDDVAGIVRAFEDRRAPLPLYHPGPNDAVDVVALRSGAHGAREVLLIVRHDGSAVAAGATALPGGFLHEGEDARAAAVRVLARETGLVVDAAQLREVGVADGPGRDPRDTPERWVRSTVFVIELGVPPSAGAAIVAGEGAARARFVALDERPTLAFDHDALIARALGAVGAR